VTAWLRAVLSEPDGTPSASRVVLLLWSVSLIAAVWVFGAWEAWHTRRMPDLSQWAGFLAAAQGSGSLGYAANQARVAWKRPVAVED
jgi:hypothetical protein